MQLAAEHVAYAHQTGAGISDPTASLAAHGQIHTMQPGWQQQQQQQQQPAWQPPHPHSTAPSASQTPRVSHFVQQCLCLWCTV